MGMQIFESSGTFDPKTHGLKVGDVLQIVCVGGEMVGTAQVMMEPVGPQGKVVLI